MAKKREVQNLDNNIMAQFIQSLENNEELKTRVSTAQDYITKLEMPPLIEQQIEDIALSLVTLDEQFLSKLQLTRLLLEDRTTTTDSFFKQFEDIMANCIKITSDSRSKIDPYSKSDLTYSSRVNQYKKWLLNILGVFLGYVPSANLQNTTGLKEYLLHINHIYEALTASRVTLRQAPQVQAETLAELPRNTSVQVFGKRINTHWVKVLYNTEQAVLEGYIQLVYLKLNQEFKA